MPCPKILFHLEVLFQFALAPSSPDPRRKGVTFHFIQWEEKILYKMTAYERKILDEACIRNMKRSREYAQKYPNVFHNLKRQIIEYIKDPKNMRGGGGGIYQERQDIPDNFEYDSIDLESASKAGKRASIAPDADRRASQRLAGDGVHTFLACRGQNENSLLRKSVADHPKKNRASEMKKPSKETRSEYVITYGSAGGASPGGAGARRGSLMVEEIHKGGKSKSKSKGNSKSANGAPEVLS